MPFFEHYRIQRRVCDKFQRLARSYDPPRDGHIYTPNHKLVNLSHKLDNDDNYYPLVSSEYQVKEDTEAKPSKTITTADDLLTVAKEIDPAKVKQVNLIHEGDDLIELLYQLRDAGYNPSNSFEAGRITRLFLEFNGVCYIIETQQLIKGAIDGVVVVEDEATYNNMNKATTQLSNQLFKKSHRSSYAKFDLDIMDEYGTRPIGGNIKPVINEKLEEIDITKAYAAALSEITAVPMFNELIASPLTQGSQYSH
jgi:hypothetical protein